MQSTRVSVQSPEQPGGRTAPVAVMQVPEAPHQPQLVSDAQDRQSAWAAQGSLLMQELLVYRQSAPEQAESVGPEEAPAWQELESAHQPQKLGPPRSRVQAPQSEWAGQLSVVVPLHSLDSQAQSMPVQVASSAPLLVPR